MKLFLEYFIYINSVYYRKLFPKWKSWEENSILNLTLCQFMLFCNGVLSLYFLFDNTTNRKFNSVEAIIFIIVFFVLDYINKKKYQNRDSEFKDNWEQLNGKEKTYFKIMTVVFILVSWLMVFLTGWLFGRYQE